MILESAVCQRRQSGCLGAVKCVIDETWLLKMTEGSGRLLVLALGERSELCPHHARTRNTHAQNKQVLQVTEGSGQLLVLAVGERSEWGRTMALVASVS